MRRRGGARGDHHGVRPFRRTGLGAAGVVPVAGRRCAAVASARDGCPAAELVVGHITGMETPVRIRAWDGREPGPVEGPVLIIRSRRALRRLLWAPGELGLARAYVAGDIDVDGDLAAGLRSAWQQARAGRRACRYRTYLVADVARLGASRAFSPNGSQWLLVTNRSFPAHLAV